MAHVVGVPKRDPCRKCQLPVFLAERLTVGKKIYHRTCLKCARCGSQLTPGSFYETEVDDAYCCETCPDEEEDSEIVLGASNAVLMRGSAGTPSSPTLRQSPRDESAGSIAAPAKSVRSSIADRLAFFEKSRTNDDEHAAAASSNVLLEKSVTDEEKSQSLQRCEDPSSKPYKMNTALSIFLNDAVEGESIDSEPSSTAEDKTQDTADTDNEESEDVEMEHAAEQPPELPKSLPPPTPSKRFTATAELQMSSPPPSPLHGAEDEADGDQIESLAEGRKKTEIQLNLSATNNNESLRLENAPQTEREEVPRQDRQVDLELSGNINRNCVTKDNAAPHDTTSQAAKASTAETEHKRDATGEHFNGDGVEVQLREKRMEEDAETTERLSVVRARLQQFEVIANVSNNNNNHHQLNDTDNRQATPPPISPHKEVKEIDQAIETPPKEVGTPQEELKDIQSDDTSPKEEEQQEVLDPLKQVVSFDEDDVKPVVAKSLEKEEQQNEETMEITEDVLKEPQEIKPPIEVPLTMETEDDKVSETELKLDENQTKVEKDNVLPVEETLQEEKPMPEEQRSRSPTPQAQPLPTSVPKEEVSVPASSTTSSSTTLRAYPEDLNPFASDDDEETDVQGQVQNDKENRSSTVVAAKKSTESFNPFDSSDDEVELEKAAKRSSVSTPSSQSKVPPPRPPPPRISRNPFGDEEDDQVSMSRGSSLNSSINRRTPVPTPRTNLSQNPTPEPTPRLTTKGIQQSPATLGILQNSSDYYGSVNSLSSSTTGTPLHRNSDFRGSNNSLASSAGGTVRMRKARKAPAPPPPVKELFPSTETINSSRTSTPSSSTVGTPKSGRKKRPAPAPPKPARLDSSAMGSPQIVVAGDLQTHNSGTPPKNLYSYPLQSELDSKLSDEEKALLEGNHAALRSRAVEDMTPDSRRNSRRLIPLDNSLLEDHGERGNAVGEDSQCDDLKEQQSQQGYLRVHQSSYNYGGGAEEAVVYRRVLIPPTINTPTHESNPLIDDLNASHHDRQLEKLKDNKEANNRNRQSQISAASSGTDDCDPTALYNKSSHGKWKRRKGPAPALPVPPRKVLQMLPLQEIRHELEIIEVQQQGLEKQGVILEKMIRDRCENERGEPLPLVGGGAAGSDDTDGGSSTKTMADSNQNSKEVEDLILQLFELVNEKNELFRRQAELMYLRRQHRLEQEQADLEYEIRVLMAQPERNKTDSDKAREEALIARLVEVVQLRNEVIECLEMDRLREAEEDLSIKQRLELHTSKREEAEDGKRTLGSASKLSKKEKRKQKESKKLSKNKKIDADKDADETELDSDKQKLKKKKKKFLF